MFLIKIDFRDSTDTEYSISTIINVTFYRGRTRRESSTIRTYLLNHLNKHLIAILRYGLHFYPNGITYRIAKPRTIREYKLLSLAHNIVYHIFRQIFIIQNRIWPTGTIRCSII